MNYLPNSFIPKSSWKCINATAPQRRNGAMNGSSSSSTKSQLPYKRQYVDGRKVCRCGSTTHKNTLHNACPLNKKNRNIAEYADATCESTGNAAKNIIAEPVVAESTQTYQTYPIAEDAAKTKSICSTLAQMRSAIVTKQVPMETPASK